MTLTLSPAQADLVAGALSFFFTVALLSYLIGDNPLYRLALHLFIGVGVGYATLVVIYQVLWPRLVEPLSSGNTSIVALAAVPLILFIFLVFKLSPRTAPLGNIAVAYLLGVGTAVAVAGALKGTLLPQVQASWLSIMPDAGGNFLNNALILVGAVTTLLTFQFWLRGQTSAGEARRVAPMQLLASIGQGFLVVTLGVVYAGLILSGIAVFSERLADLYGWISALVR